MNKLAGTLRKWTVWACVLVLATTFLISGFVKAADPIGMCIKLNAYAGHWGVMTFPDNALILKVATVVLATVEFMLGIYLLLGIRRRLTAIVSTAFMVIMTLLTVYIYLYNPVSDCGCFGDAIPLTHGQTLAKNVILLAAALYLLTHHSNIRLISERNQWLASIWSLIYIVSLALYTLHYLPLVEFTDYRRDANLQAALFDPESPESHTQLANFYAENAEGEMMHDSLVSFTEVYILTIPDIASADDGSHDFINDLYDLCTDQGIPFYALIPQEQAEKVAIWIERTGASYPFLLGEDTTIKAMIRSNPGLLLLRNGVITGKWSSNNLPQAVIDGHTDDDGSQPGLPFLLLGFGIPLLLMIAVENFCLHKQRQRHTQN